MTLAVRTVAIERSKASSAEVVPHLTIEDVRRLAQASTVGVHSRWQAYRNELLIRTLFDSCGRVSEMLSITPVDVQETLGGWCLYLPPSKKGNTNPVAISPGLAAALHQYAYRSGIAPNERIFKIGRSTVHKLVAKAFDTAGLKKPAHVGAVHVLRHSGAIYRIRSSDAKSGQDQLRHKSARMTLRYLKTILADESLVIQQGVEIPW